MPSMHLCIFIKYLLDKMSLSTYHNFLRVPKKAKKILCPPP